jgi:hypothetical protein
MKLLRRFFSSWHILVAGLIAIALYLGSPILIRLYDPTAGAFDGGYLVWVALGIALAYIVGFAAWVLWQLLFASLDRATASQRSEWGNLDDWFDALSPSQKWCAVQVTFIFCIILILACLKLVPLS